ncbi:MAG TPA: adenylyltransferase/cytidyltransferase family protein [Nitrososphaeraceae archaeon]|nr:adenylyltransferase/cytidyltransferase family protein [Nitrososphaeraceae archaeon]
MDPLDKAILASLYVSALEPQISSFDRINYRLPIGKESYRLKVQQLSELGFLEKNDDYKLSFLGRDALTVVLVGGVFDIIHPGHIHTLKAAKAQGDVLVVVIARTSTALKIKKDRRIYHQERLRKELVSSLNLVDLAIIGKEGTLYDTVEYVKPDIIALGYDQAHSEKDVAENCQKRNLNIRVTRLNTPIPETKSSKIKDELGEFFYRI